MKKLLLILLCLPMIGFGQVYGSKLDAKDLCNSYKGNNFSSNTEAEEALNMILNVTGMSKRFVLMECDDISNCLATTYKGTRYILYDREFMKEITNKTSSWSDLVILAHEIGHHVNGHTLDLVVYATEQAEVPNLEESRKMEIEADEYAGFVLCKLGASLQETQAAIKLVSSESDDTYSTHPSLSKRLLAIERGYNKAFLIENEQNASSKKSKNDKTRKEAYEEFFDETISDAAWCIRDLKLQSNRKEREGNKPSIDFMINECTKCIEKYPFSYDSQETYQFRASYYEAINRFDLALKDYQSTLGLFKEVEPQYFWFLSKMADCRIILNDYEGAINDFNRIRILSKDDDAKSKEIADCYYELGNYEKALKNYKLVVNKYEKDLNKYEWKKEILADSYSQIALIYQSIENYEMAIDYYLKLFDYEKPKWAIYNLALSYGELERYEDAIKYYNISNNIEEDARAYYNLHINKLKLGLPYCDDLKKSCSLGYKSACKYYKKDCQ